MNKNEKVGAIAVTGVAIIIFYLFAFFQFSSGNIIAGLEIAGFITVLVILIGLIFLRGYLSRSVGSIEISPSKTNYLYGEEISGTIKLNILKEIHSREFSLSLNAEEWLSGERTPTIVYCETRQIIKTKTFTPGNYSFNFKFTIPTEIEHAKLNKKKGTYEKKIVLASVSNWDKTKWYLEAKLNNEKELDLIIEIELNVK